ncbi:MAG: hypothetical protein ACYC7D_14660 [Nitrososphaerales archaeon]
MRDLAKGNVLYSDQAKDHLTSAEKESGQQMSRSLGISAPKGKNVFEFYIVSKSTSSALARISDIFAQKNVDVLGAHVQTSDNGQKKFVIFYAEMAGSTVKADEIVRLLSREEFVHHVDAQPRNRIFFEANMFPPTSGGHYRVFVMGAESWIRIISSLKQQFGSAGDSILHTEGVSAGEGIAKGIVARVINEDVGEMKLENLKAAFRASGFGILDLEGNEDRFHVTIGESIAATEDLIDHFAVGMVVGALEQLFSSKYVVSGIEHDAKDGSIRFNVLKSTAEN